MSVGWAEPGKTAIIGLSNFLEPFYAY